MSVIQLYIDGVQVLNHNTTAGTSSTPTPTPTPTTPTPPSSIPLPPVTHQPTPAAGVREVAATQDANGDGKVYINTVTGPVRVKFWLPAATGQGRYGQFKVAEVPGSITANRDLVIEQDGVVLLHWTYADAGSAPNIGFCIDNGRPAGMVSEAFNFHPGWAYLTVTTQFPAGYNTADFLFNIIQPR